MIRPARGLFAGHHVLAVFAHPDDESLACGGTLACCADGGARVSLVCATAGAAGPGRAAATGRPLADTRREELEAAADRLGIMAVRMLGHADGNLRSVDHERFACEILDAVDSIHPDLMVTFGADGLYWHPDHIALHEAVTGAVSRIERDPPVLLYTTLPPGMMRRVLEAARRRGAPADVSHWGLDPGAFGARAAAPTLTVNVQAYAARRLAALRCHRTQIDDRNPFWWLTDADAADLLGVEHFHRAAVGAQEALWLEAVRERG